MAGSGFLEKIRQQAAWARAGTVRSAQGGKGEQGDVACQYHPVAHRVGLVAGAIFGRISKYDVNAGLIEQGGKAAVKIFRGEIKIAVGHGLGCCGQVAKNRKAGSLIAALELEDIDAGLVLEPVAGQIGRGPFPYVTGHGRQGNLGLHGTVGYGYFGYFNGLQGGKCTKGLKVVFFVKGSRIIDQVQVYAF